MESPKTNTAVEFEAAEMSIIIWDSVASVEERGCTGPRKINSFEIQIAMARLQDEFRNILIAHTNQIETDMLIYSNSSNPSSSFTEITANFKTAWLEGEFHNNIVLTHTNSIETHSHIDWNSLTCSSFVTESSAGFKTTCDQSNDEGYLVDEVSCNGEELETHSHIDPNSSTCSSFVTESSADFKTTCDQSNDEGYLEDEVSFNGKELGTHSHIDPNSSTRSSFVTESSADFKTTCDQSNDEGYLEDEVSFNGKELGTHSHIDPNSSTRTSCVTESSADFKTTCDQSNDEGYLEDEVSFNGEELGEWSSISYHSSNSINENDLSDAIYNLCSIAERMITSGYLSKCIQVYVSVRKPIVTASFRRLGIEWLGVGDICWWIRGAKVCIGLLFAKEKRLCEQIFVGEGFGAVANDACFKETIKDLAVKLFNLPKAISNTQRWPVELFMILDLQDGLTDLLSDMDVLFGSNSSESIRLQAAEVLSRLAEDAKGILVEVENAVQNDGTMTPTVGGIVHPLIMFMMNYILSISDYTETRISRYPTSSYIDFSVLEDQSPLVPHVIQIIEILQFKLEEMSKNYQDASLFHAFLMNNIHYIIQKIEEYPNLLRMIGHDCLEKLSFKLRKVMIDYIISIRNKVLVSKKSERRRLKKF